MIYTYPESSDPIRQGDIFRNLPKAEIPLGDESLPILFEDTDEGTRVVDWLQFVHSSQRRQPLLATVSVRAVLGVVVTQDCDATRAENIALCEVRPFAEVEGKYNEKTRPQKLVSIVTQHARVNQKWYYLPPDERMGFNQRMAADFTCLFEVPRLMLAQHVETLRLGRLNDEVAYPHFRERVAEFFRRYPYNEWYPLAPEEMAIYAQDKGLRIEDWYPWQRRQVS